MTLPLPDGCPWPVDMGCNADAWEQMTEEPVKTRAIALASLTLRRLTAGRVGGCAIKVRPCTRSAWQTARMAAHVNNVGYGDPFVPNNWSGIWTNQCGCNAGCSCTAPYKSIVVPRPCMKVTEVKVDGTALTAGTDYWVDDNVIYAIGSRTFPQTQDLSLPDTAVGTFSVTYMDTYPVDENGAYAAGLLAWEYAQACTNGKCKLPATVTSVVRQGVSYTLPSGSFPNGETGIREVDAYIALWNPKHRVRRTRIWVPS